MLLASQLTSNNSLRLMVDQDLLSLYFADVSKRPLLTEAETKTLFGQLAYCDSKLVEVQLRDQRLRQSLEERLDADQSEQYRPIPEKRKRSFLYRALPLYEIRGAARESVSNGYEERLVRPLRKFLYDIKTVQDTLCEHNLRLAVNIAKQFYSRSAEISLLDLIQEGTLGLYKAIERFDYRRGYKLSTYAIWWIRQNIGRWLEERGRIIRLPCHVQHELQKYRLISKGLASELGHEPTPEEVGVRVLGKAEKVPQYLERMRWYFQLDKTTSLDAEIKDEKTFFTLVADVDSPDPEEECARSDFRRHLWAITKETLSPREAHILNQRFGLGNDGPYDDTQTLERLGAELQVTRERVRQIEKRSLQKLRRKLVERNVRL
ncbi:RNA polymerase sigma factor RpoD/SigA [Candidatus Woesearchaeota archaeon]|nr:RNA polymerase sigma factor RpoD/SigA [Candidatus Woesearchaeota archaeon]